MARTLPKERNRNFAARLREERRKAKLSQDALARLLGVHPTSVENWEAARVGPSGEHREKLLVALPGLRPSETPPVIVNFSSDRVPADLDLRTSLRAMAAFVLTRAQRAASKGARAAFDVYASLRS